MGAKQKEKVTIYELYDILEAAISHVPESFAEHVWHWTKSPFFTLVSTVLSARTRDSLTITKMPGLWEKAKTPEDFTKLSLEELEKLIYPVSFYKVKAKHVKELAEKVIREYNGVLPETVEELVKLPGVGRKTANLQVSVVYNKPAICVDTHVHRIMNHLGYVHTKTPEQTEMALRKKLPIELWQRTNRILVLTGQNLANHIQIKQIDNILNKYELVN